MGDFYIDYEMNLAVEKTAGVYRFHICDEGEVVEICDTEEEAVSALQRLRNFVS